MDKPNYEKGGSAGSKGSQFQVRLLVVFLLNALRTRLPLWRLFTEDKRAGKFDDVVLEWPDGAVLLQAKHKENKKRITVDQLMTTNTKKDDFSIPKYFLSYQEIKEKFPSLKNVVICTNASVNERALEFLNRQTDSPDSIISCGDGKSICYTLDEAILPKLKDAIKVYYTQNLRVREVDESIISDENLIDFHKHFLMYFDYPSGNDLENAIEGLLATTSWNAKVSAPEIYSKVMDWFQQNNGKCLTELRARCMFSDIKRDQYWQSLKQYDVNFPSNDLNFQDSNRRYHFIAEGACLLQEIRIWHSLRGIGKKALYIHPDDTVEELIEAFRLPNYTILIIVQPNESVMMEMWNQIEEVLNKYANKKVVLLMERASKLVQLIESGGNCFDVTKTPPTLEDIEGTRDVLLKMKNILFQGQSISMEDLFMPESIQDYRTSLGSETLERLVRGEQIRVGTEVQVLEEEVARCYIRRNFIRKNEQMHEGNIFEANDKLILIADSAGTGKTTILTKLAVLIKDINPHLWSLKIVLDSYSKFLQESLRKLTTQLDKLAFSVNNKVVLLLDGIDEISPNYTELVESLLENCLRAPNIFKIFATTRPHLAERLENKFQVQSFRLQPFSQKNQLDFLRNHWIHHLSHADKEKCDLYARTLVRKMSSWTDSHVRKDIDFAAIPLQVKMLAEIFQENGSDNQIDWEGCKEFLNSDNSDPKLPEKNDLTRLYKLFIEKKRDLFIDKLNPNGTAGVEQALFNQFDESIAFHRTLALEVIIYDQITYHLFSCYTKGKKTCIVNALKMGIIQEVDNRLQFVHRTFAEYFVAQCLIIELQCHNEDADFQKFLIDKILLNKDFRVCCTFFDGLLQECVDSLPSDIFQSYQRLSYDIKPLQSDYSCLVHDLAERGCVAILRLLLKCVHFKIIKDKETSTVELHKQIPNEHNRFGKRSFGNWLNILQFFVHQGGINIRDWKGRTPLHVAAGRGHLEMVRFLVEQGANISTTPREHYTPLYEAVSHGHSDVVEYLVEQRADVVANVRQNGYELYEAISRNHVRIVKYFLEKILESDSLGHGLNADYAMIPFSAAYLGRIDILKFLVERGMDVNSKVIYQKSLIFGAVMGEQLEVVKYLVQQGADINSGDMNGNTVLHSISKKSSLTSIAKFLVDSGIDIDAKNHNEETALHTAAGAGICVMAELLIKSGADVNNRSLMYSVLYTAAVNNHLKTVELLAEHGADVNAKDTSGNTVLHSVTRLGQIDVVKCLVRLGVDLAIKDEDGRTALHVALLLSEVHIAKYLIECSNIDVNSRDNDGQTELHFLVSMTKVNDSFFGYFDPEGRHAFHCLAAERLNIVKRLVRRGANFNLTNGEGQTVLYLAVLNIVLKCISSSCDQCLLVVKFLIEQGASIGTESSKGDVMIILAQDIQKDVRYCGQSLNRILQLPAFRLLDPTLPLKRESDNSAISVRVAETSEMTPNTFLEMTPEDEREESSIQSALRMLGSSCYTGFMICFRKNLCNLKLRK